MPPTEDMPASLVKSASRDARVSCETFSRRESPDRPEDVHAETRQSDDDDDYDDVESDFGAPEIEQEQDHRDHMRSKLSNSGKRFLACFSPAKVLHILPRPMMSPGSDGRSGSDVATIHRPAIPYSGPLTHSGPMGSVPHSGPLKIGGGSIGGHSAPMKVVPKGHSGPFTMMPADVVGKKKPPGYESDEPTSPEVTCIGRVRIKHKLWEKVPEENALKEPRKRNFASKWQRKAKEKNESESSRRWIWPFTSRKEAKKPSSIEDHLAKLDLRRSGASPVFSVMPNGKEDDDKHPWPWEECDKEGERKEALSNLLLSMTGGSSHSEGSKEKGHLTEEGNKEGQAPPTNVLQLMKGGSRNWDRPNDSGVTPAEEAGLIVTPALSGTRNDPRVEEEAAFAL